MNGTPARTVVVALQAVLAAENAAIFGYGVAGAYLSGAQRAAATAFWNDHRSAGDTLAAMLRARGAQPAAADDVYKLPFPVHTAHDAISLAIFLEDGVTAAYLGLVAGGGTGLRGFGAKAMQDSAVRSSYWRGSSQTFPGFPATPPGTPHVRPVQ
jgi:hypothetical protein